MSDEPQTIFGWFTYFQQRSPSDVKGLCEKLGIALEGLSSISDDYSGYIQKIGEDTYKIAYNTEHSETRQRFTIAHELGHYFLHRSRLGNGTGDDRSYRSTIEGHINAKIGKREEIQANSFAADLLMPRNLIERWKEEGLTFEDIRLSLDVSDKALKFRLKTQNIKLLGGNNETSN